MLALTPLRPAPIRPAAAGALPAVTVPQREPVAPCGWFESSWELRQGLVISELPASELAVAALWFPGLEAGAAALAPSACWQ